MDGTITHCTECNVPGECTWHGVSLRIPEGWVYFVDTNTTIFCGEECLITFLQKRMWRRGRAMIAIEEE